MAQRQKPGALSRSTSAYSEIDHRKRRIATVYDAVAGRISYHGFISNRPSYSRDSDVLASETVAVPPEEALFRRKGAPTRFEEDDLYFANERLSEEQVLPDSDLLKAIHRYVTEFYARSAVVRESGGGVVDWRSMDETALLALGILLEESVVEMLGETGDLVFVEGAEQEQEQEQDPADQGAGGRKGSRHESREVNLEVKDEDHGTSGGARKSKKRKKHHEDP